MRRLCLALAAALLMAPSLALASGVCPGMPPQFKCGGPDMADITTGTYKLDDTHAAVIAQVPHIGYSRSIFRFDKLSGALNWDPADLSRARLSVTVETASIATNVPGFAAKIAGRRDAEVQGLPDRHLRLHSLPPHGRHPRQGRWKLQPDGQDGPPDL